MITGAGECFMGLSLPPLGSRVDHLACGKFARGHRYVFPLLNLAQHHGLGDVLARIVEVDPAIEGLQLGCSYGIAHLLGVE